MLFESYTHVIFENFIVDIQTGCNTNAIHHITYISVYIRVCKNV